MFSVSCDSTILCEKIFLLPPFPVWMIFRSPARCLQLRHVQHGGPRQNHPLCARPPGRSKVRDAWLLNSNFKNNPNPNHNNHFYSMLCPVASMSCCCNEALVTHTSAVCQNASTSLPHVGSQISTLCRRGRGAAAEKQERGR